MGQRRRTDSLKARALGLRRLNGWGRREAVVSRRPSEFLNDIPEIVFIDIINRRLMLLLLLLETLRLGLRLRRRRGRRRWWWVVILMMIGMIERRPPDDGLRDLVREFIEVFEVEIPAVAVAADAARSSSSSGAATGISSDGKITRGMTAFIHHSHLYLQGWRGGSLSLWSAPSSSSSSLSCRLKKVGLWGHPCYSLHLYLNLLHPMLISKKIKIK